MAPRNIETPHSRYSEIATDWTFVDGSLPPGTPPYSAPRRRSIGWLIPTLLLVILAAGWCAFWFYAAEQARDLIAGWIEREQRAGRAYTCADQNLAGFPFRIEFRCTKAVAELSTVKPPVQLSASKVTAAVQVYQPTLLLAEIDGPVSIADLGLAAENDRELVARADELAWNAACSAARFLRRRQDDRGPKR